MADEFLQIALCADQSCGDAKIRAAVRQCDAEKTAKSFIGTERLRRLRHFGNLVFGRVEPGFNFGKQFFGAAFVELSFHAPGGIKLVDGCRLTTCDIYQQIVAEHVFDRTIERLRPCNTPSMQTFGDAEFSQRQSRNAADLEERVAIHICRLVLNEIVELFFGPFQPAEFLQLRRLRFPNDQQVLDIFQKRTSAVDSSAGGATSQCEFHDC